MAHSKKNAEKKNAEKRVGQRATVVSERGKLLLRAHMRTQLKGGRQPS